MASPQLENGHTKIANELVEALCKINLSPYESRVLWAIIRKTYGWGKKMDKIAQSQIVEMTGIPKGHISRAMKSLTLRAIVTSSGNKRIGVNKNYEQWLPVAVTSEKVEKLPAEEPKVTSTGIKKLPAEEPQKKKETTKAIIVIYPEWLDMELWNAFVDMRKKLKKPMTDYAQKLALVKIEKDFKGQENAVIEQSLIHSWQGFFPLKDVKINEPTPTGKVCEV